MSRRRKLLIFGGVGLIAIVAAGGFAAWSVLEFRRRAALAQAVAMAPEAFAAAFSQIDFSPSEPRLDREARLDGETTVVTLTFTNESESRLKDLVFDGFALACLAPGEKAEFPIKVASLDPKASHRVVLHFEGVRWLGDDVAPNVISYGWAQKPLDYSIACVAEGRTASKPDEPGFSIKVADSSRTTKYTGIPLQLDEAEAKALKKRRDDALKAKGEVDRAAIGAKNHGEESTADDADGHR